MNRTHTLLVVLVAGSVALSGPPAMAQAPGPLQTGSLVDRILSGQDEAAVWQSLAESLAFQRRPEFPGLRTPAERLAAAVADSLATRPRRERAGSTLRTASAASVAWFRSLEPRGRNLLMLASFAAYLVLIVGVGRLWMGRGSRGRATPTSEGPVAPSTQRAQRLHARDGRIIEVRNRQATTGAPITDHRPKRRGRRKGRGGGRRGESAAKSRDARRLAAALRSREAA